MESFDKLQKKIQQKKSLIKKGVALGAIALLNPMSNSSTQQLHASPIDEKENVRPVLEHEDTTRPRMVTADTLKKEIILTYKDSAKAGTEIKNDTVKKDTTGAVQTPEESKPRNQETSTPRLEPSKVIEAPKEMDLEMNLDDFKASFSSMISESLKKDSSSAKLAKLAFTQETGGYLSFEALIDAGVDITVKGAIKQNGNSLIVEDPKILTSFLAGLVAKKKANEKILPLLKTIFTKWEARLGREKKMEVANTLLTTSGIKVHLKEKK